jgi:glycine/D-amino acid oxidase-like deaminating enzyme
MKKIAIIGAGLAGLSVAWHLLQRSSPLEIVVFDARGVGGGASGVSTGLLHPFVGRQALRSWRADEGMEATRELLAVAEEAMGRSVAEATGILRLAIDGSQKKYFRKRADEDGEALWLEPEQVVEKVPFAAAVPGLWIPSGMTVYSRLYLEGLWKACAEKGASFEARAISSLGELSSFDAVVVATGASALEFPECAHLPLEPVKGQTLLCRWPESLGCSVVSHGHISPTEDPELCQIGSSYEHNFTSLLPDERAASELLKKAALFYPPAKDFSVVEQRVGVRMTLIEGYRPIVAQIAPKAWVFTGLGSRGLLYHALLGRELAHIVCTGL